MSKHGPPQQQQRESGSDDNSGSHDGSDLTRLEVIRSAPGKDIVLITDTFLSQTAQLCDSQFAESNVGNGAVGSGVPQLWQ